jgi:hypothetical protein
MSDLLIWLAAILILGGAIAGPGGHLWEETPKVLHFFGKEINENFGFKVMMAGLAAMLAGFGLVYFFR